MELKILCTKWGHEDMVTEDFFIKVKEAGYSGVDTWVPEDADERKKFIRLLSEYDLAIVSHQYQAYGNSIDEFCKSFEYYLQFSAECNPIRINSHSGRDWFTLDEQLQVIDTAHNFSVKNNITVVHETHRGRIGYSPVNARDLFKMRPEMKITADFSHWICVTESYLENFKTELAEAIQRTEHIHARVGFVQGPQIPDPRLSFWQKEVDYFLKLWSDIIDKKRQTNAVLTITPEFGPPPYMWTDIKDDKPIVNQWDVNLFMKNLLNKKFASQTIS